MIFYQDPDIVIPITVVLSINGSEKDRKKLQTLIHIVLFDQTCKIRNLFTLQGRGWWLIGHSYYRQLGVHKSIFPIPDVSLYDLWYSREPKFSKEANWTMKVFKSSQWPLSPLPIQSSTDNRQGDRSAASGTTECYSQAWVMAQKKHIHQSQKQASLTFSLRWLNAED